MSSGVRRVRRGNRSRRVPSNSENEASTSDARTPPRLGIEHLVIDRLALTFPVDGRFDPGLFSRSNIQDWETEKPRALWRESFWAGDVWYHLRVLAVGATDSYNARLDFVPAAVLRARGLPEFGITRFRPLVEEVWTAATEHVHPLADPDEARVRRIDVARDFDVSGDPGFFIRGLLDVARTRASKLQLYRDRAGAFETLYAGTEKSGHVRLYDAHRAHPERVAPGRLRFEVQAEGLGGGRGWAAIRGKIKTLTDVTADNLVALVENCWEWSGMGTSVASDHRLFALVGRLGLSSQETLGLLGYAWARSRGWSVEPSDATRRKYDGYLRQLGVALAPEPPGPEVDAFSSRLDLATGTDQTEPRVVAS